MFLHSFFHTYSGMTKNEIPYCMGALFILLGVRRRPFLSDRTPLTLPTTEAQASPLWEHSDQSNFLLHDSLTCPILYVLYSLYNIKNCTVYIYSPSTYKPIITLLLHLIYTYLFNCQFCMYGTLKEYLLSVFIVHMCCCLFSTCYCLLHTTVSFVSIVKQCFKLTINLTMTFNYSIK